MKTVYIIIMGLILSVTSKAQSTKYISSPVLLKFVGKWIAKKDDQVVTILIKKIKVTAINNVSVDMLEGYHVYKNFNKIIDDGSIKPRLLNGSNYDQAGNKFDDRVFFYFIDQAKKKHGTATLILSKDDPNELTFSLSNDEGLHLKKNENDNFDKKFTLPTKLVFQKQN